MQDNAIVTYFLYDSVSLSGNSIHWMTWGIDLGLGTCLLPVLTQFANPMFTLPPRAWLFWYSEIHVIWYLKNKLSNEHAELTCPTVQSPCTVFLRNIGNLDPALSARLQTPDRNRSGDMPSLFINCQDNNWVTHSTAPPMTAWHGDKQRGITEWPLVQKRKVGLLVGGGWWRSWGREKKWECRQETRQAEEREERKLITRHILKDKNRIAAK